MVGFEGTGLSQNTEIIVKLYGCGLAANLLSAMISATPPAMNPFATTIL